MDFVQGVFARISEHLDRFHKTYYIGTELIAIWRTVLQSSATRLLLFGIRAFQFADSDLHCRKMVLIGITSSLKTNAFRRFQSTQQHIMMKALYWSSGIPDTLNMVPVSAM